MKRIEAKNIAETISNEQLLHMFNNAKKEISDWTIVSTCNKGFTKGVAWNILAKDFDINKEYGFISKMNMILEFGKHLSDELKPQRKQPAAQTVTPTHQEPIFDKYE